MKYILLIIIWFILPNFIYAQQLSSIPDSSIKWIKKNDGYDLFIQKIPGIESVLLTESPKDPLFKETVYGLRTKIFYPVNGKEIRILDGKKLYTGNGSYFLVDSTPEITADGSEAFHLFIPDEVVYGYKGTKNGTIKLTSGTKINLRMFEKKYADYSGTFTDQWIMINDDSASILPTPTPTEITLLPPTPDEFDFIDPLLKDKIYSEEIHLKDKENNILGKTFYKIDEKGQKIRDKYATYQYDKKGNLIKISEYDPDDKLLSVYILHYDENGKRTNVDHLDASGDSLIIE